MDLPIFQIESEFCSKLRDTNRLVLEAPTGSGKSTQTPKFLLNGGFLDEGDAIVLQPRRIAARMLAKRVSWELDEPIGKTVGYQVRHERVSSRETKVHFVTEGILLRKMISDPDLKGVSCIVFDEFHERSLHADLTLARALMLQRSRRPDLKLIIMSATLDASELEGFLAPCEVLKTEGRAYPVEIDYIDHRLANSDVPIWDLAAMAVVDALAREKEGHVLVFMPGAFEIGKTLAALGTRLSAREFELLALHSEMSPQDQDRAVEGGDRRKIIVATNVAETSLTIDNVRTVVDSGQARIARYDPVRGINTLWIEKISDASAKQRAGRAGRTGPGRAVRLWSERENANRSQFDEPEVRRVDLSEMLLSLLATDIESVDTFEWFERPNEERLASAVLLLRSLDAVDRHGRLTKRGNRMSGFPLHPRYSSMLLASQKFGCVDEMALATALAQSRSILIRRVDKSVQKRREDLFGDAYRSDIWGQMVAWEAALKEGFDLRFCQGLGIHAQSSRQVLKVANQLSQYAEASGLSLEVDESLASDKGEAVKKCLLFGFPDRVCKRMDRGTLRSVMVGNRRGDLARESLAGEAPLFVACEVNEIGRQDGQVNTIFNLCSEIEVEWLKELFPEDFSSVVETAFDERQKRVVERSVVRFQDLELSSVESSEPQPEKAAEVFAGLIAEGKAKLAKWDDGVEHLIRKVNFLSSVYPEYEIQPIDEESRALLVEQCCYEVRSIKDLKRKEVLPIVREWVGPEVIAMVEKELAEKVTLSNGKPGRLRVEPDGKLTLSAKVQCLYDISDTPKFCQGRAIPRVEILAPNMRPVQLTNDLKAFWSGSYEGVKKDLKGRYPKHEWR